MKYVLVLGMGVLLAGSVFAQEGAGSSGNEPAPAVGDRASGPGVSGPVQTGRFGLSLVPEAAVPLGPRMAVYEFGGGGSLTGDLRLLGSGGRSELGATLGAGYTLLPLPADGSSLSLVRGEAGLRGALPLGDRLSLFGYGSGGAFLGLLQGNASGTGWGYSARGGLGVSFALSPRLGLSLGAEYGAYFGLYEGLSAFLGTRLVVPARSRGAPGRNEEPRPQPLPGTAEGEGNGDADAAPPEPQDDSVHIAGTELERIFPVLFKYYDENPLGTAFIANGTDSAVRNVEVRFDAERIIDNPKLSAEIDELGPGEVREVDLYALFNDQVLTITEGTRIAARIDIEYERDGTEAVESETVTLTTYDRNALRWDDDRKVAAFVTAKDEEIQRLAKNMAALSRREGVDAVSQELQLAIAQFAAMRERGLAYVVDPSSSYAELSDNPLAVDYVQFPRQTFAYQAGDCDDLSAAYCSLLESVGIDTAFITIPGHLYMAFRLDMSAREARSTFANEDDLIFREDGSVWVPVETTVLERGFMEAWSTGARQWREHNSEGAAGFFPTGEAWGVYEPVAFSVSEERLPSPESAAVARIFTEELNAFVNRQIYSRERRLLARLEDRPGDRRLLNRLGVLYARYGRNEQAREQFQAIVREEPFAPAYVNLANLAFLDGDYREAGEYYSQALEEDPYSGPALVGRARVAHRLEDYQEAEERYQVLANLAPELAERFSYLNPGAGGDGARAGAEAQLSGEVVWEETE